MNLPKEGSIWSGSSNDRFRVLHTVELNDQIWVHYIKETRTSTPNEYSCYLESFLQRFKELPE